MVEQSCMESLTLLGIRLGFGWKRKVIVLHKEKAILNHSARFPFDYLFGKVLLGTQNQTRVYTLTRNTSRWLAIKGWTLTRRVGCDISGNIQQGRNQTNEEELKWWYGEIDHVMGSHVMWSKSTFQNNPIFSELNTTSFHPTDNIFVPKTKIELGQFCPNRTRENPIITITWRKC